MNKAALLRLRLIYRYAVFSIFISLSILLTGCVYDPFYYGPPTHSHYYPRYYDYYYYPSAHVYFHFTTGFYYYLDSGVWLKVKMLPPHIKIDARDRVPVQVESDKPYLKFPDHKRHYTPKPTYRVDKERNIKEREANQRWYREYQQKQDKNKGQPMDRRRQDRFQ